MRTRSTAAAVVVSGALALTAAAMPAAQASGTDRAHQVWQSAQRARAAHPATAFAARPADGDPYLLTVTFTPVSVSGKAAVAVGTTNTVHVPYVFTLKAPGTDITAPDFVAGVDLYRGSVENPTTDLTGDNAPTCTFHGSGDAMSETCKGTVDIHPKTDIGTADAGAHWHAEAWAVAFNGQDPENPDMSQVGSAYQGGFTAPALQRYSALTVNAAPEPVVKGKTITVTGALTRANWDTHHYAGYTVQPVKLQFRKKGSTTYSTLKTVNSDSHGNLKTTFKSSVDGYWRYSFAGTSTTPAVSATGDYVEVK